MTDNIEVLMDVIEQALEASSSGINVLDELNTLHEDDSPISHVVCGSEWFSQV